MSTEKEVRKASQQFYAALNRMLNGDARSLSEIWSHGPAVTTMHPIGGRQVGWDDVRETWVQVAGLATEGKVELKDQFVHLAGDMAYEVGVEHAGFKLDGRQISAEHRVTNIYEREAGAWKIVHHHTDLSPAMVEVLNPLQSPSRKDNTAAIRRLYDLINAGDIDGFGRQLADDFAEREDLPGFPPTKAGVIQYFRTLIAAFPDLRMIPEDVIASGDKAVARVRVTGTHKGPFMGMSATGKRVEVELVDIIRFGDDGRAHEHWGVIDQLAMMQQLGTIPAELPT